WCRSTPAWSAAVTASRPRTAWIGRCSSETARRRRRKRWRCRRSATSCCGRWRCSPAQCGPPLRGGFVLSSRERRRRLPSALGDREPDSGPGAGEILRPKARILRLERADGQGVALQPIDAPEGVPVLVAVVCKVEDLRVLAVVDRDGPGVVAGGEL